MLKFQENIYFKLCKNYFKLKINCFYFLSYLFYKFVIVCTLVRDKIN